MKFLLDGHITDYDYATGEITIKAKIPNATKFIRNDYDTCLVQLHDRRLISREQQKLVYALFMDISVGTGNDIEYIKEYTKSVFLQYSEILGSKMPHFSLATSTTEEATQFIEFLLEMCFALDIPLSSHFSVYTQDICRQVYNLVINKKCVVCGDLGELHHITAVGMGRDRTSINHVGMECLSLCRKHHNEVHNVGVRTFLNKYHLKAIEITSEVAEVYRLNEVKDE